MSYSWIGAPAVFNGTESTGGDSGKSGPHTHRHIDTYTHSLSFFPPIFHEDEVSQNQKMTVGLIEFDSYRELEPMVPVW
jgi:hypothetical protein